MTKEELKEYLVEEAEYSQEEVDNMSNYELVDNYLTYEGIAGYTRDILDVVAAAFGFNRPNPHLITNGKN